MKQKTIGFFCHHCFTPIIRTIKKEDLIEHRRIFDEGLSISIHYSVVCPKCMYSSNWEEYLDPNITPALALLNCKGYKTYCSCEGHGNRGDAYILFENDALSTLHIDMRMNPWYIEQNANYITVGYPDDKKVNAFCIRCDIKYPLQYRMSALNKWVDSLPFYKDISMELMNGGHSGFYS